MEVIVPADPAETAALTHSIIASKKPTYLRLGKSGEPTIHTSALKVSYGVINEVSQGGAGTLIFAGSVGTVAVAAAKELAGQGVSVAVASMPYVSTIDIAYIKKALGKGPVIVIEEHSYRGGVGAAVLEAANAANLHGAIGLIAADQNNLSQIGDQNYLRTANGISIEKIIAKFNALKVS